MGSRALGGQVRYSLRAQASSRRAAIAPRDATRPSTNAPPPRPESKRCPIQRPAPLPSPLWRPAQGAGRQMALDKARSALRGAAWATRAAGAAGSPAPPERRTLAWGLGRVSPARVGRALDGLRADRWRGPRSSATGGGSQGRGMWGAIRGVLRGACGVLSSLAR